MADQENAAPQDTREFGIQRIYELLQRFGEGNG